MKVSKDEILLIYNSNQLKDRKALVYAKSFQNHSVKEFDVQNNSLTESQLRQLSKRLDIDPVKLVDTQSTKYLRYFSDSDLSSKGTLKVLKKNPRMIKTPIAIYANGAEFINSPNEFIKKDMNL